MDSFPSPERAFNGSFNKREFLENHYTFDYARAYQKELDAVIYDNQENAIRQASLKVGRLEDMARRGNLLMEPATITGPDIFVPVPDYDDRTGAITIQVRNANDIQHRLPETFGEFYGFTPFAQPVFTTHDKFRATIGVQIRLHETANPNFVGHLLAFGPIATTSVNFMNDDLKRL